MSYQVGEVVKVYEKIRANTVEYVSDLALQFEQAAQSGRDDLGLGPTDGAIVAMGLRLLAAQLPSQAALVKAEAMAAAMPRA